MEINKPLLVQFICAASLLSWTASSNASYSAYSFTCGLCCTAISYIQRSCCRPQRPDRNAEEAQKHLENAIVLKAHLFKEDIKNAKLSPEQKAKMFAQARELVATRLNQETGLEPLPAIMSDTH